MQLVPLLGNCGNASGLPGITSPDDSVGACPAHSPYVKEWSDGGNHPKPVGHEDLGKNWVGAGHLKVGDKIKQADGTTGVVANVITLQQTREMFNLTVSEAHTYYVGQDGWLVHNTACSLPNPNIKRQIGSNEFLSNEGLVYGPDPTFGNRIAHVQNHNVDIPTRPGNNGHGVFGGDGVALTDEAWSMMKSGAPGITVQKQEARLVYNVPMGRPVGYVGGQAGAAMGNPSASNIRIVVERGNRVISAFPFR